MTNTAKMIAFGPVPSRRLGQSLGINNIPPKICTYSCIYCQVVVKSVLKFLTFTVKSVLKFPTFEPQRHKVTKLRELLF
jgi:wyosine [tRNA(Phe)-imidazoG37] synthetase (radical SAM superfamily)